LISHDFPPYAFGGIAAVCYDLAHSLAKRGVSVTVIAGTPRRKENEEVTKNFRVIRLPYLDFPSRSLWFQVQNQKTILSLLKNFDIVHGVHTQSSAFCTLVKGKIGKPLIFSIHGIFLTELQVFANSPFSEWTLGDIGYNIFEYPLNELYLRTCLKGADHTIVCGYSTCEEMLNLYTGVDRSKVSVVLNGVNFDKLREIKDSPEKEASDQISIMYYGRLFYRKGILHLVKAFAALKQDCPDAALNIFGKGPLESKIRKMASNLKVADKIHLRGFVAYGDLIREIRRATLVCFPSLYEASPVAPLEAMACAKPVVAFDMPFMRELMVNMDNAILAKPENVPDLSDKIRILLSDENLRSRMGRNAYDYALKNHSWDLLVEKYMKIYEKTMTEA